MSEILAKTSEKQENVVVRNEKGQVISGTPNPNGRPVGTYSLKTKIIQLLKDNPDIEKQLLDDLLAKEQGLLIQMIDGRPKQDVTVEQKEAPQPIINLGNLTKDANGVVIQSPNDTPLLEKP